jgi:hypothetical protein
VHLVSFLLVSPVQAGLKKLGTNAALPFAGGRPVPGSAPPLSVAQRRRGRARSSVAISLVTRRSCRDLIRVADAQIDRAKSDLSIARLGLADVELELTTRALRSTNDGSANGGGQPE